MEDYTLTVASRNDFSFLDAFPPVESGRSRPTNKEFLIPAFLLCPHPLPAHECKSTPSYRILFPNPES